MESKLLAQKIAERFMPLLSTRNPARWLGKKINEAATATPAGRLLKFPEQSANIY